VTDPWERPGHGPSDPVGYLIERTPDGYRWTRRADGGTAGPFASRDDAVMDAEADRAEGGTGGARARPTSGRWPGRREEAGEP
jgi:hypothetical protein